MFFISPYHSNTQNNLASHSWRRRLRTQRTSSKRSWRWPLRSRPEWARPPRALRPSVGRSRSTRDTPSTPASRLAAEYADYGTCLDYICSRPTKDFQLAFSCVENTRNNLTIMQSSHNISWLILVDRRRT